MEEEAVVRRIPLKGTRGTIARRMLESATTKPQVTLQARAELGRLMAIYEERRATWEAAAGAPVSLSAVLARVVAAAAAEDPRLNGHVENGVVTLYRRVHLGVAVALGEGLIVPVLRDAQEMSVPAVAAALAAMTERARARGLTLDDVSGGTLTLTNLGVYGVGYFNPLVNPPQIAILGVGALRWEPLLRDGAPGTGRFLPLSLTFDHAAIDGAQAAQWAQILVGLLEGPERALAEG